MRKKILTVLFYGLLGIASSLALFLVFYWSLRLNASIYNLVINYYRDLPLYFWPYVILTVGTLMLFGINVPLLVYRWRKYGFPKLGGQAGAGLGSVIGIFASACPVCGSVLLSLIGITGGLAAFPLGGLELKAVSFGLMTLPLVLTGRELKRFAKGGENCPVPRDPSLKSKERPWLITLLSAVVVLGYVVVKMLAEDPIFWTANQASIINPADNQLYDANQTQLGASQGLTEDELYRETLAFNSFWFPHNYIQTALYFKVAKNTNWGDVDPKEVMGFDYSAISNWSKNVQTEIAKIPNLIPQSRGGAGCGVGV